MNQAELENYEALHQRVETGITNAREEIEATKVMMLMMMIMIMIMMIMT